MATRKERLLEQVVVAADTAELDLLKEKLDTVRQYDDTPAEKASNTARE